MGFFSYVQWDAGGYKNWFDQAEVVADVCRGPRRWLETELFGKDECFIILANSCLKGALPHSSKCHTLSDKFRKVSRVALGIFLAVPGEILALLFMGFAFFSQEIRLKHKFVSLGLSEEEKEILKKFIAERKSTLSQEKQREPLTMTCLLLSICCLLCCLVCRQQ